MPDWNPAEILGIRPKKLAITLYKELITDQIWANQRENYGYRDLTMHQLMVLFCGIPYIDARITFNSFIPRDLHPKIAKKLADYYLDRLSNYPAYHDKFEFEIVYSCYYFGLSNDLKSLLKCGFNENEIKRIEFSLLELTNQIIHPVNGLYKKEIQKIKVLEKNYSKIISSDLSLIKKIYWLIEECKAYGTLPFAGIARAAFIAMQFLKSFVRMNIITSEQYDEFLHSLHTVNRQLGCDLKRLQNGEMTLNDFLKLYGHIRPGTYDITLPRYDKNFKRYFSSGCLQEESLEKNDVVCFSFTEEQNEKIQNLLEENGLNVSVDQLFIFIKESIEGREYVKFKFTKVVSEILELIEQLGLRLGIEREEMAYLDISLIKRLYVDLSQEDLFNEFVENIEKNKCQFQYARQIKLPSLIVKPEDIYRYYLLDEEPNYIGMKSVEGDVVKMEEALEYSEKISYREKIVCIQSADPGYDFLFSKGIAGLITEFGGVNSHMAIRCAEMGIPAVIGAGEKRYNFWKKQGRLCIDCIRKKVMIINRI